MITDPWFYALAIPAMVVLGLSKGGLTTVGMLTVPLMSIVISPVQAAGIVLPLLVLSDMVAVVSYWRVFDKPTVLLMVPASLLGIVIGWATATWVTEDEIRVLVGLISVAFALNYWLRRRHAPHAALPNGPKALFWGTVSGFTSFVSHAGGPPFQMYVAPLRLEPRIFSGTSVIVFAIANAAKLVPYFFLGQFDTENLMTSAALLPAAIVSTLVGVWLVKRIDRASFYRLVYVLIFLVGLYLLADAAWLA
jgi:uncharacterized membrane protein YfcA